MSFYDKKCVKDSSKRPGKKGSKRRFSGNQYMNENEKEFTSTSAKKIAGSYDFDVTVSPTLIGHYTSKVLDTLVKSSFGKMCVTNKKEMTETEFETWFSEHGVNCKANHKGSAGGMEVHGIVEMFARAETVHDAKYKNYIGDGDTKTFKALLEQDHDIEKKECINHVQKRMGSRLRNVKKTNKKIGGRGPGKLTDKLINELTVYFGLAIRRNPHNVEKMRNDVWATFYHKISTNEKPQHEYCPSGSNSWCKWQ
ncbi:hypothetical protein ALC62_02428 [Cyphomyrmex costatus]|uniref:Mutator-like transposase domain-containing protein n=1 Tax=Cyphomyrmex costatus TaxID=456900 RepID=A0A151IN26_9HYME|nr:hypothetical protein ALC62_02428 [Cyphomyrmex costatus]